ncbi:MAG: SDR family NAD(P)-dependent oxidoreductase [Gemmatimonadales bacterium]
MTALRDRVALVTGGSRGVGRGIAIGLADAGATVYPTGRTIGTAQLPAAVTALPCDHSNDDEVAAVFRRIHQQSGQLDILVNAAWGGYERMVEDGRFTWPDPFWQQPRWRWDAMLGAGVRAAFVAAQHAAPGMIAAGRGLIVNLSYWAAQKPLGNLLYGVAKAATDKLTVDMAHELRGHGVAAVSLYPGLVRTEAVLAAGPVFDLSNSESPEFLGRVVAALATDPKLMERSGTVVVAAAAARDYGIDDIDGRRPTPLTLADG